MQDAERLTGRVVVRFSPEVPAGLLGYTLHVERKCCTFVHLDYNTGERQLTITVESVAQDPRLDSLFHALS